MTGIQYSSSIISYGCCSCQFLNTRYEYHPPPPHKSSTYLLIPAVVYVYVRLLQDSLPPPLFTTKVRGMKGCTWRRSPRATAGRAAVLLVVVIACRFWLEPLQSYYSKYYYYNSSKYHNHPHSEFEAIRVSQKNNSQRRGAGLCSEIDLSVFAPGKACGLPLSAPCFDSTRCSGALSSLPRPTMYVYDNRCSLANSSLLGNATTYHEDERDMSGAIWRTAAANAGLLAETYESACLFVHVNERVDHEPCASRAPLWNEGSNHLMVDLTDFSR